MWFYVLFIPSHKYAYVCYNFVLQWNFQSNHAALQPEITGFLRDRNNCFSYMANRSSLVNYQCTSVITFKLIKRRLHEWNSWPWRESNTMGALGLLSMMQLLPCMHFYSALEHKQYALKADWSRIYNQLPKSVVNC